MTTLTEIAYYTRKGVTWIGLGVVGFLILRFIIGILIHIIWPPKPILPPQPTVVFGKLPSLNFPTKQISSLTYELQIKEGGLPIATTSASIYFIPKQAPNLLATQRAKKFSETLGFTVEPTTDTPTVFRFIDPANLRKLVVDSVSGNFSLQYDFQSDPSLFTNPPDSPDNAINKVRDFFRPLQILPDSTDFTLTRTKLLRFDNKQLVEATSLSTTQAIRVDLFQQPIDNIPLVTAQFTTSPISAIITGNADTKKRFIDVEYQFYPIDRTLSGTYPLKTTQTAWEELQTGRGYIASLDDGISHVIIRKAYLGYYQASEYQPYLQPVFVFEGDNNFAGYVPSIRNEWSDQGSSPVQPT